VAYHQIDTDPPPEAVRHMTFVAFLPSGDCVAIPDPQTTLVLPTGDVRPGEHYLLDTSQRIPLETAGFKPQRIGPFAADGDHVYAWLDGDHYAGARPHATVDLIVGSAEQIAARLHAAGRPGHAKAVREGTLAFRNQDDAGYYSNRSTCEADRRTCGSSRRRSLSSTSSRS
jgi:hypothetical protein